MRPDQHVVHRKVFAPWYDTEAMCVVTILFSFLVSLFCFAGISVCSETGDFQDHVWLPFVLLLMSGGLVVSIMIRLIKRYISRYQNRYLKDFSGSGL